jgi:hypothetical protein
MRTIIMPLKLSRVGQKWLSNLPQCMLKEIEKSGSLLILVVMEPAMPTCEEKKS